MVNLSTVLATVSVLSMRQRRRCAQTCIERENARELTLIVLNGSQVVIEETHGFYKALLDGKVDAGKLWVPGK